MPTEALRPDVVTGTQPGAQQSLGLNARAHAWNRKLSEMGGRVTVAVPAPASTCHCPGCDAAL